MTSEALPTWNSIHGKPYFSSESGSSPSGRPLGASKPNASASQRAAAAGPRVVEGEGYPRKIVRLVRHCVALLHPGAEPRRRDGDERRAAPFFAALRNCRLEPDGRACCGWLEAHVDRHVVEGALPGQALARLPHRDSSQLEPLTALGVVHLHDSPTDTGLAAHLDEPARVERVDRPSHPPQVELVGEGREGGEWVCRNLHRGGTGTVVTHRSPLSLRRVA